MMINILAKFHDILNKTVHFSVQKVFLRFVLAT